MENIEELEVKMVKDERGRVVWPFNFLSGADFSLNNIHIPSLKPGAVRGNHYHKYSTEYIFIMSGPCRACFQDNITGEKADFLILDESPKCFKIGPEITHAFKNESDKEIILFCYEQRSADGPDETGLHRIVIL